MTDRISRLPTIVAQAAGKASVQSLVPVQVHHLLIATRNAHKTAEFGAILGREFSVTDLRSVGNIPEVEETGATFAENATLKALAASRRTGALVVADDSGLEVDALGGAPGIYSARYAGTHAGDRNNVAKLLTELATAGAGAEPPARFVCALVLARNGQMLAGFEGVVEGRITASPHGSDGFGYDPVFVPDGYDATFAQLGIAVKNRISHRARAISRLREYLLKTAEPE